MLIYVILWIVSLAISIAITRIVFEVPKFSNKVDNISDLHAATVELLRKQNDMLTLLLHANFDNKKIGLINKTTSAVKTIDISQLSNYDLSQYDIQILSKE